jgi:purine catabolism regulator
MTTTLSAGVPASPGAGAGAGALGRGLQLDGMMTSDQLLRTFLRLVLSGGGLQEVVEEVATLAAGYACVQGPGGRPLARAGQDPTAPGGDPAQRSLCVPVDVGDVEDGSLVLVPYGRPANEGDRLALEQAATTIALVVNRQLAVAAAEAKYEAGFLHDLLTGQRPADLETIAHARLLGWELDRPLVVLVAELDPDPVEDSARLSPGRGRGQPSQPGEHTTLPATHQERYRQRWATDWAAAVRSHDGAGAAAAYGDRAVGVMGIPWGETGSALGKEIAGQVPGPDGRSFSTGISGVTSGLEDLPLAYDQAVQALQIGRARSGPGEVAHFERLGVYRLLAMVKDEGELAAYVSATLGPVLGPGPKAAELRRTLAVVLETNLKAAEAARRLGVHYNTLRYRLATLERLLGPFQHDPELQLDLRVALRGLDWREGVHQLGSGRG